MNSTKKPRKISLKGLRTKGDRLFQENGKKLHPKCEACGKPTQVVHHFHPKSVSSALRFDPENGIGLCHGCHMRHHQAGDPRIHNIVINKRGSKWVIYLEDMRREIIKTDRQFYEYWICVLEESLSTLSLDH